MGRYNYLDNFDEEEAISCRRLEQTVLENRYVKKLPEDDVLKKLLIKALNQGAFSKYSETKEEGLYWLPASNAGVPIVPRDSYLHETKFMIHDVLHQLMPDIIVDTFDPAYKDIYVVARMISETMTMALADYIYLKRFEDMEVFSLGEREELSRKKIFRTLEDEYGGFYEGHYAILLNHTRFGITGKYLYKKRERNNDYYERFHVWANNVYAGDFRWTCSNYEKIVRNGDGYLKWAEYAKGKCADCGSDYWFLSDFKDILALTLEEKVDYLFDRMYHKMYDNLSGLKLINIKERGRLAKNKVEMYNSLEQFIDDPAMKINIGKNSFEVDHIVRHYKAGTISYRPKKNRTIRKEIMKYRNIIPKVILEGTDGVGKSSIKKVLEQSGIVVEDRNINISNLMLEYIDRCERNVRLKEFAMNSYDLIVCLTVSDKELLRQRIREREKGTLTYFDEHAWAYQELYEDSFQPIADFDNVLLLDRTNKDIENTADLIADYYKNYTKIE